MELKFQTIDYDVSSDFHISFIYDKDLKMFNINSLIISVNPSSNYGHFIRSTNNLKLLNLYAQKEFHKSIIDYSEKPLSELLKDGVTRVSPSKVIFKEKSIICDRLRLGGSFKGIYLHIKLLPVVLNWVDSRYILYIHEIEELINAMINDEKL